MEQLRVRERREHGAVVLMVSGELGASPARVDTHWYQLCGKREYS